MTVAANILASLLSGYLSVLAVKELRISNSDEWDSIKEPLWFTAAHTQRDSWPPSSHVWFHLGKILIAFLGLFIVCAYLIIQELGPKLDIISSGLIIGFIVGSVICIWQERLSARKVWPVCRCAA